MRRLLSHTQEWLDRLSEGISLGTLPHLLAQWYGQRPALLAEYPRDAETWQAQGGLSFVELEQRVAALAAAYHNLSLSRGRRVLLVIDNRFELMLSIFALARAGAVAVPVNPRLKPKELQHIIDATRARAGIFDGVFAARLLTEMPFPSDFQWVAADPQGWPEEHWERAQVHHVDTWLAQRPGAMLMPTQRLTPKETALLLCTSGTTGLPKAAVLNSEGLLGVTQLLLALPLGSPLLGREGRDRLLAALPLTHVMGISAHLAALCAGVPLIHCHRFDAALALSLIEKYEVNAFIGVPTMYADLEAAGASRAQLKSVQLWLSGADMMPPERARRFQSYGGLLRVGPLRVGTAAFADVYGMVELSGPMAIKVFPPSPHKDVALPALSITLPAFETRTVDEDDQAVGWGEVGRLQVRGPGVLSHYEGRARTPGGAGPDEEGWFTTGDLARRWPGGLFALAGRSKDRLKVSGFSVFPAEVEAILRTHPEIVDVVVVGLPDQRMGEEPAALYIPKKGAKLSPEQLLEWASEHVAGYRRPRRAMSVKEIPRGNHGKINRVKATQVAEAFFL